MDKIKIQLINFFKYENLVNQVSDSLYFILVILAVLFLFVQINLRIKQLKNQTIESAEENYELFQLSKYLWKLNFSVIILTFIVQAIFFIFEKKIYNESGDLRFLLIIDIFFVSIIRIIGIDFLIFVAKSVTNVINTVFLVDITPLEEVKKFVSTADEIDKKTSQLIGLTSELDELNDLINIRRTLYNQGIYSNITREEIADVYNSKEDGIKKILFLVSSFERIEVRIDLEIDRLIRFSKQNLLLGTLISIAAITFLVYEYKYGLILPLKFGEKPDFSQVALYYFPKISVVILIEVIAFFFLRLYKKSIDDIKQLQNEKTGVDFKIISLKVALLSNNSDELSKVINLINMYKKETETIPKIDKDDSQNIKNIIDLIKDVTQKIKI